MSKMRLIALSLLAVFAMSASTAASASAAPVFLVEGTELLSSEAVEGTIGLTLQKIETKILNVPLLKECEDDIGTGVIKPKGESTGRLEGKGCQIFENSNGKKIPLVNCSIREPLIAEFIGQLTEPGVAEIKGSEGIFTSFELAGEKCVIKGKYKLTGSQVCTSPEAAIEKTIHEGTCTPAGTASRLVFGTGEKTEPAQLFGNGISKLKSGKKWSAS
jgi:hypothetical protein